MHPVLRQALVLDTETTRLGRGAGIHELATFDLQQRLVREYVLDPNMVAVKSATPNDELRLVSSVLDEHQNIEGLTSWIEVLKKEQQVRGSARTTQDVLKSLELTNSWLAGQIKKGLAPHLVGHRSTTQDIQNRRLALKKAGAEVARINHQVSLDFALMDIRLREGTTLWIANAAFEAKQLGAALAGRGQEQAQAFKSVLETSNPRSPDPTYVTGKAVNAARIKAQLTGDWTGVWKAYKASVPTKGVAVRDILDVSKALSSYGHKLGLLSNTKVGHSVEVSSRLLGAALGAPIGAEVHRAAEDVIREGTMLRQLVGMTEAAQAVHEGTPEGQRLLVAAQNKQGLFAAATRYFASLEQLTPQLLEMQAVKRLARAQRDLLETGETIQYKGIRKIWDQEQLTPDGTATTIPRGESARKAFRSLDDFTGWLQARGDYGGTDLKALAAQLPTSAQQVNEWEYSQIQARQQQLWNNLGDATGRLDRVLARRQGKALGAAATGLSKAAASAVRGRGRAIAGALGVLAVGGAALGGAVSTAPTEPSPSILSYGYEQWLQHQEGMAHQGWAKESRRVRTDFGSPYQGPSVALEVLADQELLQERERWLRSQYGATHYDPVNGVFGINGVFKFGRGGYSYLTAGTSLAPGTYSGLRGKNLLALNMSDGWKMEAEDADTVVVRRGGVRGAIASFFGMNRGYSFRLAGVDAPETSHGSTSYHAPQPHAEASAAALRSMLKGSTNVQLVFDPSQRTYGRMVGAVIADGTNVNFEIIKRGMAAHLAYGKREDSIIDYSAMRKLEQRSYAASRGMWGTPWARTYREFSEAAGGDRVTFNTLAKKSKLVQNSGVISMVSMMEENQRNGAFAEHHASAAAQVGAAYRGTLIGPDSVGPNFFEAPQAPHNAYMQSQKRDLAEFMVTHGTGRTQNKFSRRGGYGQLDGALSLDTMGTTNVIWTKRRLQAFEAYGSQQAINRNRRAQMAERQRMANQQMFQSGVGHHRM